MYCGQFYASKKRKPLTSSLKSGSYDKDGKKSLEGSPGAKGTLDNYLVTSQDHGNSDIPSHSVRENLSEQDLVKRNLLLKINSSSRNEHEEPTLSRGCDTSAATEGIKKRTLEDSYETRSSTVKLMAGDGGVTPCTEKPELKQFAADFLSLYCRYM